MDDLFSLLISAIMFAGITLCFRAMLSLPLISASLAFWFGWAFLLTGGIFADRNVWVIITTDSAPYIQRMFNGALLGFLTASLIPVQRTTPAKYISFVISTEKILKKFGRKAMIALFLIGVIFFAQRIATVGFSMDYLSDVRAVYNERNGSALLRIGSHLTVIITLLIIMRGMVDAYRGVNLKALGITILAAAPLGLANGGRIFLLAFIISYIASLLLTRSSLKLVSTILTYPEFIKLIGAFALLLLVFAVMGFKRGGYGDEFDLVRTILVWPVSTLGAMDDWVSIALADERTYGLNTFGWIFDFLYRVGIIDLSEASNTMRGVLHYFSDTNNSALVIPRSILPDIIFDFGPNWIFISIAVIAFLLEFFSTQYVARSYFGHVLAVQSVIAGFMSIQTSVLTPAVATSLFWAVVLMLFTRRRGNHRK